MGSFGVLVVLQPDFVTFARQGKRGMCPYCSGMTVFWPPRPAVSRARPTAGRLRRRCAAVMLGSHVGAGEGDGRGDQRDYQVGGANEEAVAEAWALRAA